MTFSIAQSKYLIYLNIHMLRKNKIIISTIFFFLPLFGFGQEYIVSVREKSHHSKYDFRYFLLEESESFDKTKLRLESKFYQVFHLVIFEANVSKHIECCETNFSDSLSKGLTKKYFDIQKQIHEDTGFGTKEKNLPRFKKRIKGKVITIYRAEVEYCICRDYWPNLKDSTLQNSTVIPKKSIEILDIKKSEIEFFKENLKKILRDEIVSFFS